MQEREVAQGDLWPMLDCSRCVAHPRGTQPGNLKVNRATSHHREQLQVLQVSIPKKEHRQPTGGRAIEVA